MTAISKRTAGAGYRQRAVVFDSIGDGVCVLDAGWRFTYVNVEYCRARAVDAGQLLGRTVWEVFPDKLGTDVEHRLRTVMEQRTPQQFEVYFERIQRWFENRCFPTDDGTMTILCADITERKRLEIQTAEQSRMLERQSRLLELAPACIWELDGAIVYWSRGMQRLYGHSAEEALGRSSHELLRTRFPAPLDAILEQLRRHGEWTGELRHLRKNGEPLVVTSHWLLSPDEPRDTRGLVIEYESDITAQKEAELRLQEADRAKDEFMAMLAHELRNPLAPLRNALRLLEPEPLSERGGRALQIGKRQLHQMTRLVDDLLEVSRVTRGKIELRPERVMIQYVVYGVAEAMASTLAERSQRISFEVPGDPVWVTADPVRLAQIVENLLTNASKYSDAGSHVVIRIRRDADEVTVEVEDDGIGIDREHLPTLFDLFTQVDRSIARSRGGLGIGLALVKRLVEMHGGRVGVHSDGKGKGSVFSFTMPRSRTIDATG